MFDISEFLAYPQALLIAPAGYGKTHFIAEAVKHCNGKNLILTHTHAGVASLRQKLNNEKVSSEKYNLETISSFAQKYVHAYRLPEAIPSLDDQNNYFKFVIEQAADILDKPLFQEVITKTYSGIFVDEYQDCLKSHHSMILAISQNIPLRIMGDPLQGIFDFNEPLVDFDTDLNEFDKFDLTVPWRWEKTNFQLGKDLHLIREDIEKNKEIDWSKIASIEYAQAQVGDEQKLLQNRNNYIYRILEIINKEDLLIISSQSSARGIRLKLAQQLRGRFQLVEAIDEKEFYKNAQSLDDMEKNNFYAKFREISLLLLNKTEVNNWLGENKPKNKRDEADKKILQPLISIIDSIEEDNLLQKMHNSIECLKSFPGMRTFVHEQFHNVMSALQIAYHEKITVFQAMIQLRNYYRSQGRSVPHRAIGTTLLTKGLEFDNVVVLNPNSMNKKHLYVAITRARKRLFIYQEQEGN